MTQRKTKKVQKIIAKQQFANVETGEVKTFDTVSMENETDFNFHKVWLKDLGHLLMELGNPKTILLGYLFVNVNSENKITFTIRKIAEKLQLGKETIRLALNTLMKSDIIKTLDKSYYMLNPDLIAKCRSGKRKLLLAEYYGYEITPRKQIKTMESKAEQEYAVNKEDYEVISKIEKEEVA